MKEVMIVEDEAWLGELYQSMLHKAGYAVRWCRDNYDAIAALDERQPHLIVLDVLLPWTNGIQLLHEMNSYSDLMHIPVIMCTTVQLPNALSAQQLRPYGVVAVLDKTTMRPRDLLTAVKEALHANVSH